MKKILVVREQFVSFVGKVVEICSFLSPTVGLRSSGVVQSPAPHWATPSATTNVSLVNPHVSVNRGATSLPLSCEPTLEQRLEHELHHTEESRQAIRQSAENGPRRRQEKDHNSQRNVPVRGWALGTASYGASPS